MFALGGKRTLLSELITIISEQLVWLTPRDSEYTVYDGHHEYEVDAREGHERQSIPSGRAGPRE